MTEPEGRNNAREIILSLKDGGLRRICETHRSYDALEYVLLHPQGQDGWHLNARMENGKKMTAMKFYCYRLMVS